MRDQQGNQRGGCAGGTPVGVEDGGGRREVAVAEESGGASGEELMGFDELGRRWVGWLGV
jgi:hypothetical protein